MFSIEFGINILSISQFELKLMKLWWIFLIVPNVSNDSNLIWLIYDHFSSFENWLIRDFSFLTQMFLLNLWKFINKSCFKSSDLPKYQFSNNLNLIWLIYNDFSHFENCQNLVFLHLKCFITIETVNYALMEVVQHQIWH